MQIKKGVNRPRGIFPSLPGGMDSVIKTYFDRFRGTKQGLPPELIGKVDGRLLEDQTLLNKWRVRTGGLRYFDKKLSARLMGLLDDCLVALNTLQNNVGRGLVPRRGRGQAPALQHDTYCYIPLDYKTRGWAPKDDTSSFYEHQIDIYEWLLKENGYTTAGLGYLVYYHPIEVRENGIVQFEITPKRMESDTGRARKLFEDAVRTLQSDSLPGCGNHCEFCPWGTRALDILCPQR